jgi:hypothetical protein
MSRDDLKNLPIILRDRDATEMLERLGVQNNGGRIVLIEELEHAALTVTTEPPPVFELGAERRSTPRREDSLDEARTIAGRVFYALNGLSERERVAAVEKARRS